MKYLMAIVDGDRFYTFVSIGILNYWSYFKLSFQIFIILIVIGTWNSTWQQLYPARIVDVHSSLRSSKSLFMHQPTRNFKHSGKILSNSKTNKGNNFLAAMHLEHWANTYFPGQRNGRVSSTVAESFNSWILEERQLPITSILDWFEED